MNEKVKSGSNPTSPRSTIDFSGWHFQKFYFSCKSRLWWTRTLNKNHMTLILSPAQFWIHVQTHVTKLSNGWTDIAWRRVSFQKLNCWLIRGSITYRYVCNFCLMYTFFTCMFQILQFSCSKCDGDCLESCFIFGIFNEICRISWKEN